MTYAERRAKSRLANSGDAMIISPPSLLSHCIPRGRLEFDEIESSGAGGLALYNKLLGKINLWVDALDPVNMSVQDGLFSTRLLMGILESLTELRIKIGEQRAVEAHDVTATMQENLQPLSDPKTAKIEETLALLRSKFEGDEPKPN